MALSKRSATPEEELQKHRSVGVSALILGSGTLVSRILGLFRDMLTARYLSVDVRDAFLNAFRLPNLFRRILGEGALSASFIPIFVAVLRGEKSAGLSESESRARKMVCGIFSVLISVAITVSLLATIFMDDILRVILSGDQYMSVPGKFELTVKLARIMFSFMVLIGLYAFFMAILNGLKKFAMTAFAPCLFNIVLIAAILLSPRFLTRFPWSTETILAWAVLLGGALQMAILIPSVVKSGYFPRFTFSWNNPDMARFFKAVLPGTLGLSITQMTILVNMHFASYLPKGSHSYLYYADRILELPLSLFVVSIGAALLPTLTKYWAEENRTAMSETINHYIGLIVFLSLPAAIGMFMLAHPITEVLFMGHEFKYVDAVATAQIIQIYSLSVIVSAGVRILAQGFYAIQNTWFPAVAGLVALCCHIIFAYTLSRVFALNGLAMASVISATVNLLMLGAAYNSWVGSLQLPRLLKKSAWFLIGAAAMVLVLLCYGPILQMLNGRIPGARTCSLFLTIAGGGGVYMFFGYLVREKAPAYFSRPVRHK